MGLELSHKTRFSFFTALFLVLFVLSTFYLDRSLSWNTVSRAAMPLSLVLEGDLAIDEYAKYTGDKATIGDHYYSDKSPLAGFLMVPVLYVANAIYPLKDVSVEEQLSFTIGLGALVFGALPFVLMLMGFLKNKVWNHTYGVKIMLFYFMGSFLFAFSGTFFSHTLTAFLIFLTFTAFEKEKWVQVGVFLGMSFMSEYTTLLLAVVFGVYFIVQKKYKGGFQLLFGLLPFLLLQLFYNHILTHSPWDFAYKFQEGFKMNSEAYGFQLPSLEALFHITISPYRGLIFYTPLIIAFFSIAKFKPIFNIRKKEGVAFWMVISYVLLIASSKSWYQGWTFGPRYLNPIVVLVPFLVEFKPRWSGVGKTLFYGLGIFGLIHVVLNKATVLYPSTEYKFPLLDVIVPRIMEGKWNQHHLLGHFNIPAYVSLILFLIAIVGCAYFFTKWHRRIMLQEAMKS